LITVRRVVISVIVAGAVAALVFGFSLSRSPAKAPVYTDPAVAELVPKPGDHILRQDRVGATLKPNFTLAQDNSPGFVVDQTGIPQDEIEVIPGLNQYFFTPGSGKELSQLPSGRVCVALHIKSLGAPDSQSHSFNWCFYST
jgi:hypothetical protein